MPRREAAALCSRRFTQANHAAGLGQSPLTGALPTTSTTRISTKSRIGARMPARCFEYSCAPHPSPAELGQPPLRPTNHGPVLGSLPLLHMHRSVAFNSVRFCGPDNATNRAWRASPCSSVHRVSSRCRRSTSRARPQPMEPSPNRTRIAVSLRMRLVPPCASYVYCTGRALVLRPAHDVSWLERHESLPDPP